MSACEFLKPLSPKFEPCHLSCCETKVLGTHRQTFKQRSHKTYLFTPFFDVVCEILQSLRLRNLCHICGSTSTTLLSVIFWQSGSLCNIGGLGLLQPPRFGRSGHIAGLQQTYFLKLFPSLVCRNSNLIKYSCILDFLKYGREGFKTSLK